MKVSLALSGGGVRALAHLGIVKVLQEHGFEIAAVSGSSGGALVGALLCDGKSPDRDSYAKRPRLHSYRRDADPVHGGLYRSRRWVYQWVYQIFSKRACGKALYRLFIACSYILSSQIRR